MLRCARSSCSLTVFAVATAAGFAQDAPTLCTVRIPSPPVRLQPDSRSAHPDAQCAVATRRCRCRRHRLETNADSQSQSLRLHRARERSAATDHRLRRARCAAASQTAKVPPVRLPPGIFTNFTPVPADGPVNVLLLDALNTPMKDQSLRPRASSASSSRNSPSGTRIAIFVLNDRLIMLQGFTSDLLPCASGRRAHYRAPPLVLCDRLAATTSAMAAAKAAHQTMPDVMGNGHGHDAQLLVQRQTGGSRRRLRTTRQNRALQTLDALNRARALTSAASPAART